MKLSSAKLIQDGATKNLEIYVLCVWEWSMLSKTLKRYLSEPDNIECSGFLHFVGNYVLKFTYIPDFAKLKVKIHEKQKTPKLVLHFI